MSWKVEIGPALALGFAFGFGVALLGSGGCSTDPAEVEQGVACNYHTECPNQGVCFEGLCHATASCLERSNCKTVPVCAGERCFCNPDHRCVPVCVTDNDCAADGQCVDGVCTPYPVSWSGMSFPSGPKGPLQVGLGKIELDFPMGVSMAGYAARQGPRTPYMDSLGGSNAWLDKPDVRAIAFSDGEETFVILRIPIAWSTDEMLVATARKVQERTGQNLVDHIVTSAMHSHAHPARFWHMIKGLSFGIFGYDEFSYEIFDRLTNSFADAVILALESLAPARFGYSVVDNFDPEDLIHRDRRERNNALPGYMKKDDRMLLMRVDDARGQPIAVLVNLGIHGTVFDESNPVVTGDAPGGIENVLTLRASEKYGHPVLGIFLQGNAGDISPAGDDRGHNEFERVQLIGERTWGVIAPILDAVTTESEIEVSQVTGRVPISHEVLGYEPGEFHDENVECESSPPYFRYGAFQCVEGYFDDEDPDTKFTDGKLACVFAVECLTTGFPIPQFQKTVLSAIQLGSLALVTMPGEPVSQFGRGLGDRLRDALPGVSVGAVLGYGQDHHFYLLNEDDWFQGGYEASRDIWGWRLAPYLAERSLDLARELERAPNARDFDRGNLKPMVWVDPPQDMIPVPFNDTEGDPSDVLQEVPEDVERLETVTFSWRGGFPGLDRPHIVLEVEREGAFVPFLRGLSGLPYDDSTYEMVVHYDGTCNRTTCTKHAWRVVWEDGRDFPLGRYRLRARGRAQTGGRIVDYDVASRTFDLGASQQLLIYGLKVRGGSIEGRIVDRPAVELVDVPGGGGRRVAASRGHFLRSTLVPSYLGAPLPVDTVLTFSGTIQALGAPASSPVALSGTGRAVAIASEPRVRLSGIGADGQAEWVSAGDRATSRFEVEGAVTLAGSSGPYAVRLTITDPFGNRGTVTSTISN